MNEKEILGLLDELCSFNQLKYSNIPDIDLYMDQVTTFIDEKLSYLKRDEKEVALTKTMINNYTKSGILMPPKKKKYSRQHMVLIILTYYLKQILSINDIQTLFSPLVNEMKSGENYDKDLENIYNGFLDIEESEINDFKNTFHDKIAEKEKLADNDDKNINELIVIVLSLVIKSSIQKRMAEKIIDEFFKK
ncbi:DUF1836 domain-containing protein [Clostridium thailandense]|uniref:DUF1836 domain-containing protein n=1 Tax=Clostridium thailandense TaxID=2794346 RepID=A0A949TRJ0_9CLOT|nr:DUF1836 domain-containing protein [Clostridium thailandense]MBV7274062.1 DUF1836 domain-containing protein [Clostridium thailandense]MCH5137971.1 DUF1836 domain-containing protein [Clostridiaceae bacterium UIB06]